MAAKRMIITDVCLNKQEDEKSEPQGPQWPWNGQGDSEYTSDLGGNRLCPSCRKRLFFELSHVHMDKDSEGEITV